MAKFFLNLDNFNSENGLIIEEVETELDSNEGSSLDSFSSIRKIIYKMISG